MDEQQFQIFYSTGMEHYQFIELHLEGIYAQLSGKQFCDGLQDVGRDGLYRIIRKIQEQEKITGLQVFSNEEYKELDVINQRRNFWVHSFWTELVFDCTTGLPKKIMDMQKLQQDVQKASSMRKNLYDKYIELLQEYDKTII